MIRVAICDDDKVLCAQLEDLVLRAGRNNDLDFDVSVFYTGESLCGCLEGDKFDLLFLDIELATMTGIEIGRNIRDDYEDNETQIVFMSGMASYAMSLFKIRPLDYLIKPLNYETVENAILTATKLMRLKHTYFEFSEQRCMVRIPVSSILYFESMGKKIRLVTRSGEHAFYGKKDDILKQISSDILLEIHNSYLINYNLVEKYNYTEVVMINKDVLPISQTYRKRIRNWLLKKKKGDCCDG